jgi:hypothetical protein
LEVTGKGHASPLKYREKIDNLGHPPARHDHDTVFIPLKYKYFRRRDGLRIRLSCLSCQRGRTSTREMYSLGWLHDTAIWNNFTRSCHGSHGARILTGMEMQSDMAPIPAGSAVGKVRLRTVHDLRASRRARASLPPTRRSSAVSCRRRSGLRLIGPLP